MDTTGYSRGAFLSAQEIKERGHPVTVTVTDEGEYVDVKDGAATKRQIVICVQDENGASRRLGLNKINWAALSDAWGTESKLWVGRALTLTTHKVTFRGQVHDGLLLTPVVTAVESVEVR